MKGKQHMEKIDIEVRESQPCGCTCGGCTCYSTADITDEPVVYDEKPDPGPAEIFDILAMRDPRNWEV